jgi:hypothetical protein
MAPLVCVVEADGNKHVFKTAAVDKASLLADLAEKFGVEPAKLEYFHEDLQDWVLLDEWEDFVSQKRKSIRVTRVTSDANKPEGVPLQRPEQLAPSNPSPRTASIAAAQVQFGCFLSHHKAACAMEARFLKEKLGQMLNTEAFLDSDDLYSKFVVCVLTSYPFFLHTIHRLLCFTADLTSLLDHVRDSGVLAIIQSANVLERPWCLLELYAAIEAGVPIIAISVQGKGYDFARAAELMLHLDTELERVNPGACAMLRKEGVDPVDAAFKLSTVLPSIISVKFDSSGSANSINASLLDIVDAMKAAKPVPIKETQHEWLQSRLKMVGSADKQHGVMSSPSASTPTDKGPSDPAAVPLLVPELPVSLVYTCNADACSRTKSASSHACCLALRFRTP